MHTAHLDNKHVLLMVEGLSLEIRRQLVVPPMRCKHDVKRRQPQGSRWGNKRADDTTQGSVTKRCEMLLHAVPMQHSVEFYLSLQLFPVRPPPSFFATALQEKPAPCVPPSSRMTFCSLWSS